MSKDEESERDNSFVLPSDSEDDVFKPKRAKPKAKPKAKARLSDSVAPTRKSFRTKKQTLDKPSVELAHRQKGELTAQLTVPEHKEDEKTAQPSASQDLNEKSKMSDENGETEKKENQNNISKAFEFCPICQMPLSLLKISAATHSATCNIASDVKACPDGLLCLSSDTFHYRDFSHQELAAFRDSENFVEPDIIFTPQKAKLKRTPLNSSGGKKRPSRSPVVSASKVPKREEACCSKDLPPTPDPGSPDMFAGDTPADRKKKLSRNAAQDESKKKLAFDEDQDPDDPKMQNDPSRSPSKVSSNGVDSQPISEISASGVRSDLQSSMWCSDLILSGDDAPMSLLCNVKTEPESQNTEEMDVAAPLTSATQRASNATVVVEYSETTGEPSITGSKVECTDDCKSVHPKSYDTLQANCSVTFKTNGFSNGEAVLKNPLSVTLLINHEGWQAVQLNGSKSSSAPKIDVSLCGCGHAVCVQCCVDSRDDHSNITVNREHLDQHEIFFATMTDLGLRRKPAYHEFLNRKELTKNLCNKITISTTGENMNFSSHVPENGSTEDCTAQPQEGNGIDEETNIPIQENKEIDAFALLRKNSKQGKRRSATPTSLHMGSNSRSSTPTPGSMVVTHGTAGSWTLVPALGKQNNGTAWGRNNNRKVPAYKRIPDTQFVVDAFSYGVIPGVKVYFLSHFHSDHYMGLTKKFSMPIYCTKVTANLVQLKLRVARQYLHILKPGEPQVVCGVEVEVFDAFHCPGAVMFLFRLLDGQVFLHVGDFRAHPSMEEYPQLRLVNKLFLDTTYCDPSYDFPSQEEVVQKVIQTVRDHLAKNKFTLFVSGTYTIGKEKVFMGIAEEFDFKIWTTGDKRKILECLEDKQLLNRLTPNPSEAQVHVLPMRDIALEELQKHLNKHSTRFSHVVGLKPTGWQTSTSLKGKPSDFQKTTRGKCTIYGVPYSEHSSYSELRRFVRFVKPKDIQVTVNVGKSAQYRKTFQQWLSNSGTGDSQAKMVQYFSKE